MSNGKRGAEARPVTKSRALTTKSRALVTAWPDAAAQGRVGNQGIGNQASAGSEADMSKAADVAAISKTGDVSEAGDASDVREVAHVGAATARVKAMPTTLPSARREDGEGGVVTKATRGPERAPQRPAVPWSAEREAIFLETLGQTCSVTNAVKASGLSSAAIYRRRDASDTFRAAWVQALREAYTRLETELLSRALNGVRKPVWYAGRKVGSVVEYSDRLALSLLGQYRETCRGSTQAASPQAEARIVLIETLARMNRGMGGEG
jgi:hypothetical protein